MPHRPSQSRPAAAPAPPEGEPNSVHPISTGRDRPVCRPAVGTMPGAHAGAPLPVAPGSVGKMTRAGLEPAPTVRHLSGWSAHPFPVLSFRGGHRPPWESVPHFCDGDRTQRGCRLPRRFAPRNDRNARMRHAKPPPMGKAWSTAIPHS